MGKLTCNMATYKIQIAKNQKELSRLVSQVIINQINSTLATKERFQLSLSGGSTPCMAYSILREESLPWNRVDILLGDERWVPSSDESSNSLMLKLSLIHI